jgi:ribosomal protein S18 acetylase RimI-like enzyme
VDIEYRLAESSDLSAVATTFATAIDDLDKKHGFFSKPTSVSPPNPQYAFWLSKHPESFWVATYNGRVVGYTYSFLRGSLWFLADLFILPGYQGKGVGGKLIKSTLESWKGREISNRALITPAFNRASVSLYMRHGMLPRQPVYFARARRDQLVESLVFKSRELEVEEVSDYDRVSEKLAHLHITALGFPPGWHNELFFRIHHAKCLLFKKSGRTAGYSFVRANGRIGPLVVKSEALFRPALELTLKLVAEKTDDEVTIFFPATNAEAVRAFIEHRFSITYPLLFLSAKPMGDWGNYLFYSPGLM